MTATFGYFVTGTDTGIGKTLVSTALLQALRARGVRAAGMKPVAAGAEIKNGQWRNDDADRLALAAGVAVPAALATPYLLREAVAPHIAAAHGGVDIDPGVIRKAYDEIACMADAVVVEGVGGFRVPLNERFDTADLAQQFGLPVILVVGLRLGCLNHALLTAEAIAARRLVLAGWVANTVDTDMACAAENVQTLRMRITAPMLGLIPRLEPASAAAAAACLDFSALPDWPAQLATQEQ